MTSDEANLIVKALFEEIDEDELLGSMLYCMSDSEKTRLQKKLVSRMLLHTKTYP